MQDLSLEHISDEDEDLSIEIEQPTFLPARKLTKKLCAEDVLSKLPSFPKQFSSEILDNFRSMYICPKCGMSAKHLRSKYSLEYVMQRCAFCREHLNDANVKATLSDRQKLKCPRCFSNIKRNDIRKYEGKKYKGKICQRDRCLNPECKYRFVFDKLYDDEAAKEAAVKMFFQSQSFYKIGKVIGRKADTAAEWVAKWLFENYPDVYDNFR